MHKLGFGNTLNLQEIFQQQGESLLTGLLWYYTLDEVSGSRSDSGPNSLDLTENGTVASATGKIDKAAAFDGDIGDRLIHTNAALYDLSNTDFTFTGWVKFNNTTASQVVQYIGLGGFAPADVVCYIEYDLGQDALCFCISNGISTITTHDAIGGTIPTGELIFFACRYDVSTQTAEIRLNGNTFVSNFINNNPNNPAGSQDFMIGDSIANNIPLDGLADEINGYDRKLTDAEVDLYFNNGAGFRPTFPPVFPVNVTNSDGVAIRNSDGTIITT